MGELTGLEAVCVFGMFTPGLIRGAFWYDSPSIYGIIWTVAVIGLVMAVVWVASLIFGRGLPPVVAMILVICASNFYAYKGSTFSSNVESSCDSIDGDIDE